MMVTLTTLEREQEVVAEGVLPAAGPAEPRNGRGPPVPEDGRPAPPGGSVGPTSGSTPQRVPSRRRRVGVEAASASVTSVLTRVIL